MWGYFGSVGSNISHVELQSAAMFQPEWQKIQETHLMSKVENLFY